MGNIKCPKCGAELSNDDSFCPACGAYISVEIREEIRKDSTNLNEEETKTELLKCYKCGSTIGKDDKFCQFCGASLEKMDNVNHCTHCGGILEEGALYCSNCGKNLIDNELELEIENDNCDDIKNFVGDKKASYYTKNFIDIEKGRKMTWNWCSFLFSGFWLFYRKMYLPGIIALIISSGFAFLTTYGFLPDVIRPFFNGVFWFILGLLGNLLYYKKYKKVLNATKNMSKEAKENYLKANGGTSVGLIFAYFGLAFLVSLILTI